MQHDSAGVTVGRRRALTAVLGGGMACAVALLALAGGASGATEKDEGGNRLAGKYEGTNDQGYRSSSRSLRAGRF